MPAYAIATTRDLYIQVNAMATKVMMQVPVFINSSQTRSVGYYLYAL